MPSKKLLQLDENRVLYIDMVLVEYTEPILLTCKDENEKLYLCDCYCHDSEKWGWIVTETTPEKVIMLLENKITIREAVENGSVFHVVIMADGKTHVSGKTSIQENCFPTEGYYMDADADEFADELSELRDRTENIFLSQIRCSYQHIANVDKPYSLKLSEEYLMIVYASQAPKTQYTKTKTKKRHVKMRMVCPV